MLAAIGAASAALDAIQSFASSSKPKSSQPAGFASVLSDAQQASAALSSGAAGDAGFGANPMSFGNMDALFGAVDPGDSTSGSSQQSQSASSTYSAINQLTQQTAVPVGLSIRA
jgi:hypothetical protein